MFKEGTTLGLIGLLKMYSGSFWKTRNYCAKFPNERTPSVEHLVHHCTVASFVITFLIFGKYCLGLSFPKSMFALLNFYFVPPKYGSDPDYKVPAQPTGQNSLEELNSEITYKHNPVQE